MNETTKESKILDAIYRYSQKQTELISREVEEYKEHNIEQATEAGLKDAYELIQREITQRKTAILIEYSQKQEAVRRELYELRSRIENEVFQKAAEKLSGYMTVEEYRNYLISSAKEAKEIVGDSPCVIKLRKADDIFIDDLRAVFANAEVVFDEGIRLGGIKIVCEEKRIMIDCTLDTRLEYQRRLFAETSQLKVV